MAIVYVTYRWYRVDNTFVIIFYAMLLILAVYTLVSRNGNTSRKMGKILYVQQSLVATRILNIYPSGE